ncbi:profilin [Kitasatospora sp. NPDC094019]|uniref:profilin n=1 Tax=Kitasatospora sp. NPDC094019 TaxID=3364091 RepID=UPI003805ECF5
MWQTYVDNQLVGSRNLDGGIIVSAADGGTWAQSSGFSLNAGEGAALVALYKNPGDAFTNGVTVGGVKYTVGIKADARSIYVRKGSAGIVLVRTSQAILVGRYSERHQPAVAAQTVEKLGDYLIENGR